MQCFLTSLLALLILFESSVQKENDPQSQAAGVCRGKGLKGIELQSDTDLKALVEKFFAKVLKVLINNDPFQIEHQDLEYKSYGILYEGFFENLILSFMSTTKINNIVVENSTSSIKFGFDMTMDQFQINGAYKLNFSILTMLPIYGEGNLGILLKGITISLSTTLKETDNKILQMTDLDIGSSLKDSKVQVDNLFDSKALGEYISAILTDMLPSTINDGQKIFGFANIGVKALLNKELCSSNITLDTIIKFLIGFVQ